MADESTAVEAHSPVGLTEEAVLRVSGTSAVQDLALAVVHAVAEHNKVVLRAVGAGAVNQAIKAIAIARGMTAAKGVDLLVRPGFTDIVIKGEGYSAITLLVFAT